MKVLKFGGGCLKDVESIKKLAFILEKYHDDSILVVLSAFGKITNMLENKNFQEFIDYTTGIMIDLDFPHSEIEQTFANHVELLAASKRKNLDYPSRVCLGEYICSAIVHQYLSYHSIDAVLLDSALCIWTQSWNKALHSAQFHSVIFPKMYQSFLKQKNKILIAQGFISSDINSIKQSSNFQRTTLGREGSDYSAAIFGRMLNVSEVILFKDVDGIYDTDPKINSNATFFPKLSYIEAFEICNNGNTVVHPNTIQHLKAKGIPLRIQNFYDLNKEGTLITNQ